MKVTSVWSPKGGCGKTTTTIHLAGYYASIGERVLVLELDEQKSIQDLKSLGMKFPFESVVGLPEKLPEGFSRVIIDHPPGTQNKPTSGQVVVPVETCVINYNSYKRARPMLNGCEVILVCNKLRQNVTTDRMVAIGMKEDYDASWIPLMNVIRDSIAQGKTVHQMTGTSAKRAQSYYEAIAKRIDANAES